MIPFNKKYSPLALVMSVLMLGLGWYIREFQLTLRYKTPTTGDLPVEFRLNTTTSAFEGYYIHKPLPYSPAEIKKDIAIRRVNLRRLVDEMRYDNDTSPVTTERVSETDWYVEYRILIPTEKTFPPVSAVLFIPKNVTLPAPAILFLHGHFEDNERLRDETGTFATNNHAITHAKAGFITLALENRGTGEFRKQNGMDQLSYINYELLQGRALVPLLIRDAEKSLDYLKTRPEVDTDRIGVAGVSLGGELTMFIAALHTELKAVVISGFINTYQGLLRGHVHDLYWPGVLQRVGEIPQIASVVAPRHLLLQHGQEDKEFFTEGVIRENALNAVLYIKNIYSLLENENKLTHIQFEGGHQYENQSSIEFFKSAL